MKYSRMFFISLVATSIVASAVAFRIHFERNEINLTKFLQKLTTPN